jgi:hypothetical protein
MARRPLSLPLGSLFSGAQRHQLELFLRRNLKEDFKLIDGKDMLRRIVALPVLDFHLKNSVPSNRFAGPMAQDFMAAFHLGSDDKTINTGNEMGVTLAAIQGLDATQRLTKRSKRRTPRSRH